MSAPITAGDRAKLAAILERLASDSEGERQAAAQAAVRFVRARGTTFTDILAHGYAAQIERQLGRRTGTRS